MQEPATSEPTGRRRFHYRGLTSFVVTLSFPAMAVSGGVLYAAPRGREANWAGWAWLDLGREQWVALHLTMCTLFVIASLLHLYFNWRPLWSYVHRQLGHGLYLWKELLLTVVLVAGLSAAAIVGLSPARQLIEAREGIKAYWAHTLLPAPFPHAELLTLEDLQQRAGVSADRLAGSLQNAGVRVDGTSRSILELAEANGTTPAALFAVLSENFPELGNLRRGGWGRGQGRMRGRGFRRQSE